MINSASQFSGNYAGKGRKMPKFLEKKLKKEYPGNPNAVYGTMNKIGAMQGNKETAKGRAMQKQHDAKTSAKGKRGRSR